MEKADKAIALAVDNAARIESTARLLRSHINGAPMLISAENNNGNVQFGSVDSDVAIIVAFPGGTGSLTLNGVEIASGNSPLLAKIGDGGNLVLTGASGKATALIIH